MRHFCSPELDCLGKTIRRVRGSGDSTYSHVVGQVSKWVRKSSQAAGQPRGEKALVSVGQAYHQQTPVVAGVSWSCWDSPTCLWSWERQTCHADAPATQQWLSRGAGAGTGAGSSLPRAAPARQPQTLPWQHVSMKTENTHFFSAELIKKCCRRQRRGQGWLLRAEWRMWLTFHYYAANCCVQSVGWPPPCSQAPPRLTAQLMINEQLSNQEIRKAIRNQ